MHEQANYRHLHAVIVSHVTEQDADFAPGAATW